MAFRAEKERGPAPPNQPLISNPAKWSYRTRYRALLISIPIAFGTGWELYKRCRSHFSHAWFNPFFLSVFNEEEIELRAERKRAGVLAHKLSQEGEEEFEKYQRYKQRQRKNVGDKAEVWIKDKKEQDIK